MEKLNFACIDQSCSIYYFMNINISKKIIK